MSLTLTLPKLILESLVLSTPAAAVFAVRGMLSVELEALLPIDRLPLAAPPDCGVKVTLNVVLWPAARAIGKVRPLKAKPVPVKFACVIVRLEPPALVRVSEMVCGEPACTLPKFRLDGVEVSVPAVATLAASGTLSVGLEALLAIERLPLAAPLDCELKVTLNTVLWPAARVTGRFKPVIAKPAPETFAWDTITLEPPELVRVSEMVCGVPACTLPKFRLDGVEVSDPAVTALPESGTASVPFDASLANDTAALAAPPDCGLKVTLKAALWPAARVMGRFKPLTVKPELETLACDTVTLDPPELESAADKVCPLPSCTLPKLRLEGFDSSAPGAVATAETGMLTTALGASLVTAMLPVALPADWGVKVTVKFLRWPAPSVSGKLIPLILKPLPVMVA